MSTRTYTCGICGEFRVQDWDEFQAHRTQEILALIEEHGWPMFLDLSGKDLSGIDLSREAIAAELKEREISDVDDFPPWARAKNNELRGINLLQVNLQKANLVRANLQGAVLSRADLREAQLAAANLQEAFLGSANLQEASLRHANLQEADLAIASLQGADLLDANLQEAKLRYADLQGASLAAADLQEAHLANANLQGANLTEAKLQGAKLGYADLKGASLANANLQGASLVGSNLQGAFLSGADLQGAGLQYSHLEKLDFFVAVGLEGAYFYNTFFDDTRIKSEQLGKAIGEELDGEYDWAKEAYLALKNNFAEIGRYDDAAWAYRKERRMEKLAALEEARKARRKRDWKGAIPHYAKVVGDQFVELVCDYGESVGRVLVSLVVVYVLFTLMYGLTWSVIRVRAVPAATIREPTRNLVDLLRFSLGAMTTMDLTGLEPRNGLVELVAGVEALLGIFLAGLLGFVAGNRIRRS